MSVAGNRHTGYPMLEVTKSESIFYRTVIVTFRCVYIMMEPHGSTFQIVVLVVVKFHLKFMMTPWHGQVNPLQWRHKWRDGVSNHQPHDCLLNRLFKRRSKKTSKLRVTGLCAGNSPGTGEFAAQMASNAENVSIWWRHHLISLLALCVGNPSVNSQHKGAVKTIECPVKFDDVKQRLCYVTLMYEKLWLFPLVNCVLNIKLHPSVNKDPKHSIGVVGTLRRQK